eukprot:TRINITY_DN10522_c0_g1_i1.p1 TRINITY_DN10522_c0_g1~~TRINITY_DN10522_c0_g1_i1.p1  ORF type:complete len:243 (+),score=43.07 TRINITY_DN10522_c0_g1_i1:44-772(+)
MYIGPWQEYKLAKVKADLLKRISQTEGLPSDVSAIFSRHNLLSRRENLSKTGRLSLASGTASISSVRTDFPKPTKDRSLPSINTPRSQNNNRSWSRNTRKRGQNRNNRKMRRTAMDSEAKRSDIMRRLYKKAADEEKLRQQTQSKQSTKVFVTDRNSIDDDVFKATSPLGDYNQSTNFPQINQSVKSNKQSDYEGNIHNSIFGEDEDDRSMLPILRPSSPVRNTDGELDDLLRWSDNVDAVW